MKTIYDRLRDGEFKNNLPYPKFGQRDQEHNVQRKAYDVEDARLYDAFKAAALEEVGLTGHPKADAVFAYAWEQGHSAGFSEVMNYLPDLAELVK